MSLRIAVLGGAGEMGSRAVEDLAASPGVERVTVLDRNEAAGRELAARLEGAPAQVAICPVDAMDHAALVRALHGHDVAASALGPFHLFESRLIAAALDAGLDYASICDEWEAAEAAFEQFGERARRQGRVVLTGLGTSPGMTNVAVRFLAGELDRVRKAEIFVYQPLDAGGGEAVLRHMLFIVSGQIAVWRGGRKCLVPACSERREVAFPRFGKHAVWNMGHSEPLTIPRYFPAIEEVGFYMGFGRGSRLFVEPARRGWWRRRWLREPAVRLLARLESGKRDAPAQGAVRIDVLGEKDGREVHRMVCGVGEMREATGLSLSIGTLMLARRELTVQEGGVYAPEGCIEPRAFIRALRARGVEAWEDLAMTRPVAAGDERP